MAVPKWASGLINENDLQKIQQSVTQAEAKTSGEIVPMIVHRSITTGHVPLILLLVHILWLSLLVPWAARYIEFFPMWALETLAIFVALALVHLTKQLDFVQRMFTPKADQVASVMRRAQLEFFLSNIKSTHAQTGVLIFVSVLERQAVVLADQAIASKLPADSWKKIVDDLIEKIKAGECTAGLCHAIETSGVLLSTGFPIQAGDTNELPNVLIIKE